MQSRAGTDHLGGAVNALRRILQAIRLSSSVVHDTLGITGAQLFVLQQLAEIPGASLREVAERTLTDQSSVSVVVSRLVDAGHVVRRISAADGRRTELTLTESGRALARRAPEPAQQQLVAALRATPAAQLRVTAGVLDRVARALSPSTEPAPMFFEPPGKRRGAARRPRSASKPRPARPARARR
jgi:DNA-binding MarR family transcriptional regulator